MFFSFCFCFGFFLGFGLAFWGLIVEAAEIEVGGGALVVTVAVAIETRFF